MPPLPMLWRLGKLQRLGSPARQPPAARARHTPNRASVPDRARDGTSISEALDQRAQPARRRGAASEPKVIDDRRPSNTSFLAVTLGAVNRGKHQELRDGLERARIAIPSSANESAPVAGLLASLAGSHQPPLAFSHRMPWATLRCGPATANSASTIRPADPTGTSPGCTREAQRPRTSSPYGSNARRPATASARHLARSGETPDPTRCWRADAHALSGKISRLSSTRPCSTSARRVPQA
jgi:hypothetical protein